MAFRDPPPEQKIRKLSLPVIVLGILAILFVAFASQGNSNQGRSETTYGGPNIAADSGSAGSGYASTPINRVDRTMSDGERRNWEADPESYGFSEEDRAFAAEHGVDESELRATETILRERGL